MKKKILLIGIIFILILLQLNSCFATSNDDYYINMSVIDSNLPVYYCYDDFVDKMGGTYYPDDVFSYICIARSKSVPNEFILFLSNNPFFVGDFWNGSSYFTCVCATTDDNSRAYHFSYNGSVYNFGSYAQLYNAEGLTSNSSYFFLDNTLYDIFVQSPLYSDRSRTDLASVDSVVVSSAFFSPSPTFAPDDATMFSVITDISSAVGLDTLYDIVDFSIPLIAIAVSFGIGYLIVIRLIRGVSKGNTK